MDVTNIVGLSSQSPALAQAVATRMWGVHGRDYVLCFERPAEAAASALYDIPLDVFKKHPTMPLEPWQASPQELLARVVAFAGEGVLVFHMRQILDQITLMGGGRVVVPDVTTPERAQAIRQAGGVIAHVGQPCLGVEPGDAVVGDGIAMVLAELVAGWARGLA